MEFIVITWCNFCKVPCSCLIKCFIMYDVLFLSSGQSPLDPLPGYANPCWQEISGVKHLQQKRGPEMYRLTCLPGLYLAGLPKCGTTDLHDRLILHPHIHSARTKEIEYWTKQGLNRNGESKSSIRAGTNALVCLAKCIRPII